MANKNNEHEVTQGNKNTVAHLSATGMKQESIAAILSISVPTLMKYYRHEYENGNDLMVAELMPISMGVAKDPDHKDSARTREFLLERKGGFTKTEKVDHGGSVTFTMPDELSDI